MPWLAPNLSLVWGPYVRPSPEDEKALIEVAVAAEAGGLATKHTALAKVRGLFGYKDLAAAAQAIRDEKAANLKDAQANMKALGMRPGAKPGDEEDPPHGEPPTGAAPKGSPFQ